MFTRTFRAASTSTLLPKSSLSRVPSYSAATAGRLIRPMSSTHGMKGFVGHSGAAATPSPKVSMVLELRDKPGALHEVLKYFWKYDLNITRIESRPKTLNALGEARFDFFVDFESPSKTAPAVSALLASLEVSETAIPGTSLRARRNASATANISLIDALTQSMTTKALILDEKDVNWFPRHLSELDLIANRTLDAGADLESDHPGFNDQTYRARRAELATVAQEYVWNEPIPMIDYTPDEIATWGAVWDRMEDLLQKHACVEYKKSYESMKEHCGYSRTSIPQQQVRWREGECVCCVLFSP